MTRGPCGGAAPASLWALLLCATACVDNPYVAGGLRADTGDGGPSDASMGDAGADGSAVLDPCQSHAAALVCSGFERSELEGFDAQVIQGDARLERSDARARSGSGALHAVSSDAESTAVVARELEPRFTGTLHLRVWLYVPGGLPTETMNLLFLGDDPNPSLDPAVPFRGLDLNLEDGALQVYSPQSVPDRVTGAVAIPRDRWFCLRMEVELADAGAVRAFVDDGLALEAAPLDTLPDAGVHLLRAGIDWTSGQTAPFEVFMDDLVLADALVPCSAP
jgi:hypothetical protein